MLSHLLLLTSFATPVPFAGPSPSPSPSPVAATRAETVVVTATLEPVPLRSAGRELSVISREEIDQLPARSIADVLRLAPSVEVRARGAFGVQADFQVRGASFGQSLVLIDGVRINDAQSGHHNADFPLSLDDVERIEVLRGPGSSLHGADAFGGVIQVVTRAIEGFRGEFEGGSFGSGSGRLGWGQTRGGRSFGLGIGGSHTDGFMADRDADEKVARARVGLDERTTVTVAHLDKEFGANGFYGPAPSREWTQQSMATASREWGTASSVSGMAQAFYRTHSDRFIYDRRNPSLSENRHRTHAFGLAARGGRPLNDTVRLSGGAEAGSDLVKSSNLGDHSYRRASVFSEAQVVLGKTMIYPGLRFDAYESFGTSLSPTLALAQLIGSSWVGRASVGRAFRVPTYTELYYRDPNHEARSDLTPEIAWSAEVGAEWSGPQGLTVGATAFERRDDSVIDWVRASAQEKWHTENLRDVTTRGVELNARMALGGRGVLSVGYTGLSLTSSISAALSKYVLDYARRSFTASAAGEVSAKVSLGASTSYKLRQDGRAYWVVDARAAHRLGRAQIFAVGQNLLDTRYQEVRGVDLPGRSFSVGLSFSSR